MQEIPSNRRVWFAVLGGPLAWATYHVASLAFGWARCSPPGGRQGVPVHGLVLLAAAAAAVTAVAAELQSWRLFTRTRDAGNEPPAGRVHHLALIGLTVNPLVLAIILMSAVAVAIDPLCRQS